MTVTEMSVEDSQKYVLFASGGNDSVALVQFSVEAGFKNVAVVYSNTGWASVLWPARVAKFRDYVEAHGFSFHEIPSEGMENLIRRKKGWPANKPKFCTYELKIKPAQAWLEQFDPNKEAICMVGIRREESTSRRSWPKLIEVSDNHGGRPLFSPLVDHTEQMRNELLKHAGWEPLPYRSKECSPCVNANRADFRALDERDILKVEANEILTGRNMYRPRRFMGARGIREVIKWAWSERGKYEPPDDSGCDSGMCGS
jgi:3'-phosphoadenosine 5'-phosphosulfate sulfotransferase (PAPS reductase)/FAD synthetase